jgi:hypothetical protein
MAMIPLPTFFGTKEATRAIDPANQRIQYLILVIIGYVLIAKLIAIFRYHYLMDEFVDISIGADLFRGLLPYRDIQFPRPFLFNYILSLSFHLFDTPLWVLWFNRFLIFLTNVAILFLVYKTTKYYTKKVTPALLGVLIVATTTPFLFNGCRLRCDVINSFLYLLVFYSVLTRWEEHRWAAMEGGFLGLAFLISQKSAYYFLLYYFCLMMTRWIENNKSLWWNRVVFSTIGLLVVWGIFAFWLWVQGSLPYFYQQNIQRAFHVGIQSDVYNTYQYLLRFGVRNLPSALLLMLAFACLFRWKKSFSKPRPNLWLIIHALGLIGVLFFHKARFPFFFLIAIPILGIFVSVQMHTFSKAFRISYLVVGLVAAYPLYLSTNLWKNSAGYQYEVLQACEAYLRPEDSYFDGIGMVFTRKKASQLNMTARTIREYYDGYYPRLIPQWIHNQCKLIISNYRIQKLKDPERSFISHNYLPVSESSHIMLPGKLLAPDNIELEIHIEGTYKVLKSLVTNITIDGREITDTVYLHRGKHRYSLESDQNSVVLIDSSVDRFQKRMKHSRNQIYFAYSW